MKIVKTEREIDYSVEIAKAKIERALLKYDYVRYKVLSKTEGLYEGVEVT